MSFRICTLAISLIVPSVFCGIVRADSPASLADRWPAFRGTGTSISAAEDLPLEWSDQKGIAWQVDLPGYGQSSPVVWANRIYTTTMQGDEKQTPTVLCHDLKTGRELWKREFVSTQTTTASNYVTRSSPTPVVDAENLYTFFESGELITLDHEGATQWQRSLVEEYGEFAGNHGVGSSLAATRDGLLVLVEHAGPSYLLAVDKSSGQNLWKQDYESRVSWSSPAVGILQGESVVVTSGGGYVTAYSSETGDQLWQHQGVTGANVPSPTIVENSVYIGASDSSSNRRLKPVPNKEPDQDEELVKIQVAWQAKKASCSFNSPLVYQGVVYYVNKSGVAFAVHAANGTAIWKRRLAGSCWASPLAAGERVYFFCKSGETTVIKATKATDAMPAEILTENTLSIASQTRIYGVAAVSGRLILRTGQRLICVSHD